MPKYIDADALRKRMEQIAEESKPATTARPMREDTPSELLRYGTARAMIEWLDEIPAADVEPKRRWIPVTEDVPHIKEGCVGAVVVNAVYWAIGKYISMPLRYVRKKIRNKLVERWEYMDGSIIHKSVLYWMPLPEPPKEVSE